MESGLPCYFLGPVYSVSGFHCSSFLVSVPAHYFVSEPVGCTASVSLRSALVLCNVFSTTRFAARCFFFVYVKKSETIEQQVSGIRVYSVRVMLG